MPAFNAITPEKLARLVGTPACPAIVDVRSGGEALIPGSIRRPISEVARWSRDLHRDQAVLVCVGGGERSAGAAAWLRHEGLKAEVLEGGFDDRILTDHRGDQTWDGRGSRQRSMKCDCAAAISVRLAVRHLA